jgi:hypothetical protein
MYTVKEFLNTINTDESRYNSQQLASGLISKFDLSLQLQSILASLFIGCTYIPNLSCILADMK